MNIQEKYFLWKLVIQIILSNLKGFAMLFIEIMLSKH